VSIACEDPYGAFNFLVRLGDIGGEDEVAGGFPMSVAWEVLRRGLIGDLRLFDWLNAAREGIFDPRTVRIILLDEARQRVCEFVRGARNRKSGSALSLRRRALARWRWGSSTSLSSRST
jgi:hypothetical protein